MQSAQISILQLLEQKMHCSPALNTKKHHTYTGLLIGQFEYTRC